MTSLESRRATPDDLGTVVSILDEAAAWLRSRDIRQCPPAFDPSWVQPAVEAGEVWLFDGNLGTLTMDHDDPLWADRPARAAHVHRLAVRRAAAGLGGRLLDWAADRARAEGLDLLRLDCVASNGALCAHYERRGFVAAGTARVGGAPGQRVQSGTQTLVARHELPLA